MSSPYRLCACGCGETVTNKNNTFLRFHHLHRPKIFNKCKNCGTRFRVSPSKIAKKFCSQTCYSSFHKTEKQCPTCSTLFKTNVCSKQIYCSAKCSNLTHRGVNNPMYGMTGHLNPATKLQARIKISKSKMGSLNPMWKPKITRKCQSCGKPFKTLMGSKRKFCSRTCSYLFVSERMKANNPMKNPKSVRKMSATMKKKIAKGKIVPFMCTSEGKVLISKIARKKALTNNPMKNPIIARKAYVDAWKNGHRNHSILETDFLAFVKKHNLPITFVGDGTIWINHKNPDFRVLGQKKCIETACSVFRGEEYVNLRRNHFSKHGWDCLVLLLNMHELFEREEYFLRQVRGFIER